MEKDENSRYLGQWIRRDNMDLVSVVDRALGEEWGSKYTLSIVQFCLNYSEGDDELTNLCDQKQPSQGCSSSYPSVFFGGECVKVPCSRSPS